jgi:hypothetical protein
LSDNTHVQSKIYLQFYHSIIYIANEEWWYSYPLGEKTPAHLHAKGSLERILSYGIIIEDEITQSLLKIKIRTENVLYVYSNPSFGKIFSNAEIHTYCYL